MTNEHSHLRTPPEAIWLCPVHCVEFWVPHGGICPASGCREQLVAYRRDRELQALREAVRAFLVGRPLDEQGRFKDARLEALYRAAIPPSRTPESREP